MQLVQTSAHDIRIEAQNLHTLRQRMATRPHNVELVPRHSVDEYDAEVSESCKPYVLYLTQSLGDASVYQWLRVGNQSC